MQFWSGWHYKLVAALLGLAALVMFVQVTLLSGRQDGLTFFTSENPTFVTHDTYGVAFYVVCAPNDVQISDDLPVNMERKTELFELHESYIFELVRDWNLRESRIQSSYGMENGGHCKISKSHDIPAGTYTLQVEPNTVAIEAFSQNVKSRSDRALFLIFALSIWMAAVVSCLRPIKIPPMRLYVVPIGVAVVFLMSILFHALFRNHPVSFFYSFGYIVNLIIANFLAQVMFAMGCILWFAKRKVEVVKPQYSVWKFI